MEPSRRLSLTHAALTELESDLGIVPVFYPRFNWAGRRSHVTFEPGNPFGHTNALFAKPV
jgi:peptide/nickel transport system substrate-binding protein